MWDIEKGKKGNYGVWSEGHEIDVGIEAKLIVAVYKWTDSLVQSYGLILQFV